MNKGYFITKIRINQEEFISAEQRILPEISDFKYESSHKISLQIVKLCSIIIIYDVFYELL